MEEILQTVFWGNTVQSYLIALGVFFGGILFIRIIRKRVIFYLRKWAERTEGTTDDFLVSVLEQNLLPVFNLGVLYLAMRYLTLHPKGDRVLDIFYGAAITWFLVRIIIKLVRHAVDGYADKQEDPDIKKKQMRSLMAIVQMLVWLIAIIFLLSNLGFNVTGIVAGLGIGGIAIALAAQAILGDLFSYFVIFFDKPFEPGDFIMVDDKKGTVEKVGLKTTRVRSLTGEQLIFSNTNLTNSRLHNFKRLERRRIAFTIGVTYETSAELLEKIPQLIKEIIEPHKDITFDRAHLSQFADSSLNYEIVYFVDNSDFVYHMDKQQAIYLHIIKSFRNLGIEFAYPTQTVYEHKLTS
jgi:small-conductance mechanosensitive channel